MNIFYEKVVMRVWNHIVKKIGKVNFLIIVGVICAVVYVEVVHYKIVASYWIAFPKSKNLSVKVLFVSDPQLLGLNDEHWLYGPFTRWDSDRFLAKGFQEALNHVQPDAVIFMGDLFDEGSSSTDVQFESYVKRFNRIFYTPKHIKRVVIPGDNDIAREGFNFIESKKLLRFKKFFPSLSKPITSVSFLDIFKFDDYVERIDHVSFNISTYLTGSQGKLKIMCNHFGILNYLPKLHSVMKGIQPNLIIAGHEHESLYITCTDCWTKKRRLFQNSLDQDYVLLSLNVSKNLKSEVIQIVIPTCSYRMGFPKMGYGFLELDYLGLMNYTVLWLPDRYNMLTFYVWFCCISLIILTSQVLLRYFSLKYVYVILFRKLPNYMLNRKKYLIK